MLDSIMNSFWFDMIEDCPKIDDNLTDEETFKKYLFQFQSGDFSCKKEFVDFFVNSDNWNIYVLGIRLFMAICSHSDFELLKDFLSDCNEDQLQAFLAYVPESLTLQVIPYLLALYEEWEDTSIGDDIAYCIREMLGEEYNEDIHYTLEELGDVFVSFSKENDLNMYYYRGQKYFSGEMTKRIISMATYCRSKSMSFLGDQMTSILSNGTGLKCPVNYDVEISDDVLTKLYEYVNEVIAKEQIPEKKYFYNHII